LTTESSSPGTSPGGRSLARLVRLSTARPRLTIIVCLVLTLASMLYTARRLTFQTSSVELLPQHLLYVQRFKEHLRDFGELNDIVVVVEAPNLPRGEGYADRLATRIKALPGAGRVTYRVDPDLFKGQALLYLSADKLASLRDAVLDHREFIEQYAARPTLPGLFDGIGGEIARRLAAGFVDLGLDKDGDGGGGGRFDSGVVDTLLRVVGEGLDGTGEIASPWTRVFSTGSDETRSGHFVSADDRLLFILVEPRREASNFTDNEHFINGIRGAITALRAEFPDVRAGVTGTPALSNDEMLTAFHDSTVSGVLSFVLTLGFLLLIIRRLPETVVMLVVLTVSLAWSLALITATVGHLSIFSVMFVSLLVGIGIDYGIYIYFRYAEEMALGHVPRQALVVTAYRTGPGILFGSLMAAGTFGVLVLTEFRGIQEFGFIAGLSVMVAFVAMVTLFPATLLVMRRRPRQPTPGTVAAMRVEDDEVQVIQSLLRRPILIVMVAVVVTAASLTVLPSVRFDYNRLALQAKGTESVVWEQEIMKSRRSGFAALATADSLPELTAKRDAFAALPGVSDVVSVLKLVPRDQEAKIALLHTLAPQLGGLRVAREGPVDVAATRASLAQLKRRLQIAQREAEGRTSVEALRSALARADALLARLERPGPEVAARLARVQFVLRDDFIAKLARLQENLDPHPITVAGLPAELTRKFIAANGRMLMQIYPAIDTWQREGAQEFVRQVRTVDPGVTGSPVISYEASRMMEAAYFYGTLYAAVLVTGLAIVVLRRPLDALLSLSPVTLAVVWTIGFMHVLGLSFNLANVWGLPLIIGSAAEFGLAITLRHREAVTSGGALYPRSTVMAVLLNGLTTIAGFGSLMIARHQGIFGLGLLLTVGTVVGLTAALVVLPVLLRLVERARLAPAPNPVYLRKES
jgi:hopanoid biosynthesis associated RND transporter like protein HpnN